jgi:hypothetical protein
MPPRPPARPTAVDAEPAPEPPVYQWRYQAGKGGHLSAWMDVDENAGTQVYPGNNRITSVEFRIKPAREICEAEIRVHGPDVARYYRCTHDLGHRGTPHLTSVRDMVMEWPNESR